MKNVCVHMWWVLANPVTYLAGLQSSTRELQWLEYLKSVFLKIPNVTAWFIFQNQVTYV